MKLDSIDINQVLWAVRMFKHMYIEQRYGYKQKEMLDWSHWFLDYANGILDRAIEGKPEVSTANHTSWHRSNPSEYSCTEPFMETYK